MFTKLFGWVSHFSLASFWKSIRLWLDYFLIFMVLALGGAGVWLYKQNNVLHQNVGALETQTDALSGEIDKQRESLTAQEKAIQDLVKQRKLDSQIVQDLLDDYRRISTNTADAKRRIRELEYRSEEIKDILNGALPASVRSVLEDKVPPTDAGNHDKGGAGNPS